MVGLYFQRFFPKDVFGAKINFRNPCGFGLILAFTFMICDVSNAKVYFNGN